MFTRTLTEADADSDYFHGVAEDEDEDEADGGYKADEPVDETAEEQEDE